jgi:hypothetical protein
MSPVLSGCESSELVKTMVSTVGAIVTAGIGAYATIKVATSARQRKRQR